MLTQEILEKLRSPISPDTVKWKVQSNPKDERNMALVVAFIDARDAAELLDLSTLGDWSDTYGQPVVSVNGTLSIECALTVCGVTRRDVGSIGLTGEGNEDTVKAVYSDAFKRAAVKFGVGSSVYRYPQIHARVQQFGKSYRITEEAQAELGRLTALLAVGPQLPRFQHLWVFGATQASETVQPQQAASFAAPTEQPQQRPQPQPTQPSLAASAAQRPQTRLQQTKQPFAPATDAQKKRIIDDVVRRPAAALAVDGVGDKCGVESLSKVAQNPLVLNKLDRANASILITALAELSQRTARTA